MKDDQDNDQDGYDRACNWIWWFLVVVLAGLIIALIKVMFPIAVMFT